MIKCEVFSSFSELKPERSRWDDFAASSGAPIYVSFDWCRIWWEFYGRGRRLAVFFVLSDDQLIGLFPLYIDNTGSGPFSLRIARPVGSTEGPTRMFDPPVRADVASSAVKAVVDTLFHEGICDIVNIGPMGADHPGVVGLGAMAGDGSYRIQVKPAGVLTFFDLSKLPDNPITMLGGSAQRRKRYEFRYLARLGANETLATGTELEVEAEFLKFAQIHTENWNAKNRPGHFKAWPKALEFHTELAKRLNSLGRLRLFKIEVGSDVISYDYGYVFGRAFFWELRARSLDSRWTKISLGSCAMISLLRRVAHERMTCLHAGIGHYDYKVQLGAQERSAVVLRVFPKKGSVGVRVAIFTLVRGLIEILYFKIWYMRIQPSLPKCFRWPIWELWSRMSS